MMAMGGNPNYSHHNHGGHNDRDIGDYGLCRITSGGS
jgi:hypothetical protein